MHPEAEREREGGEKARERERVSVCVKELFHLHPRVPGEAFHANPFPGVGFSLTQWDDTHTHTHKLGSLHPTVKALQSCFYTQTDTRTHSARWDDREEMASSSWGVPSLLYRNCSTPGASPRPILTLCACMCICVGVCCAVCLCAGKFVSEWGCVKLSPLITSTVPVALASCSQHPCV